MGGFQYDNLIDIQEYITNLKKKQQVKTRLLYLFFYEHSIFMNLNIL